LGAENALADLTTEKPGSPYHWITEDAQGGETLERVLMGTSGATVADETTKMDVLKNIGKLEEKFGGAKMPVLVEVRLLPKDKEAFREIWVVSRSDDNIPYTVSLYIGRSANPTFRRRIMRTKAPGRR